MRVSEGVEEGHCAMVTGIGGMGWGEVSIVVLALLGVVLDRLVILGSLRFDLLVIALD